MSETLQYVYAIVPAAADPSGAPRGIDGLPVAVERDGGLGALVTAVPADSYRPEEVESASASLDWLAPRARAHDAVVTWASDQWPTIPLPVFSMFAGAPAVRSMLRERAPALRRLLDRVASGREYTVRVYVIERELRERIGALSAPVRELEETAQRESPGKQFLMRRKADALRGSEADRVIEDVAASVRDRLARHAQAVAEDVLPGRGDDERGGAVLDASFLVGDASLDAFRAELTALASEQEPNGFRFDFTGPWPPYHFVREGPDAG